MSVRSAESGSQRRRASSLDVKSSGVGRGAGVSHSVAAGGIVSRSRRRRAVDDVLVGGLVGKSDVSVSGGVVEGAREGASPVQGGLIASPSAGEERGMHGSIALTPERTNVSSMWKHRGVVLPGAGGPISEERTRGTRGYSTETRQYDTPPRAYEESRLPAHELARQRLGPAYVLGQKELKPPAPREVVILHDEAGGGGGEVGGGGGEERGGGGGGVGEGIVGRISQVSVVDTGVCVRCLGCKCTDVGVGMAVVGCVQALVLGVLVWGAAGVDSDWPAELPTATEAESPPPVRVEAAVAVSALALFAAAVAVWAMIVFVLRPGENTIGAAWALYISTALAFAGLYVAVVAWDPQGAFAGINAYSASWSPVHLPASDLFLIATSATLRALQSWLAVLYFSLTTQTLVGLGDITSTTPTTNILVVLQQCAGVAFHTLIIAQTLPRITAFSKLKKERKHAQPSAPKPPASKALQRRSKRHERRRKARQEVEQGVVGPKPAMHTDPRVIEGSTHQINPLLQPLQSTSASSSSTSSGEREYGEEGDGEDGDGDGGVGGEGVGGEGVGGGVGGGGGRRASAASAAELGTRGFVIGPPASFRSLQRVDVDVEGEEEAEEGGEEEDGSVTSAALIAARRERRRSKIAMRRATDAARESAMQAQPVEQQGRQCECSWTCWMLTTTRWILPLSLLLQMGVAVTLAIGVQSSSLILRENERSVAAILGIAATVQAIQVVVLLTTALRVVRYPILLSIPTIFQLFVAVVVAFAGIYTVVFFVGPTPPFSVPQRAWRGAFNAVKNDVSAVIAVFFEFIYFSLSVASTAGFGDVVPQAWLARIIVMFQAQVAMILNIVLLGFGIGVVGEAYARRQALKERWLA